MRYRKRALSMLLALTMILVLMPAMAFADDESEAMAFTFHLKKNSTETIDDIDSLELVTGQATSTTGLNNIVYYTYAPDDGSTKSVVWTTSDNTVVMFGSKKTVTTTGKQTGTTGTVNKRAAQIKGLKAGEADVTITCGDATKILHVTVKDPVNPETVTLNDIENMHVGDTMPITPTITPDNANYSMIQWFPVSNDYIYITGGKITAKAEGTTEIYCRVKTYGGDFVESNHINLTVSPALKPIRIGDTGYDTLKAAFAAARDGDTIQIDGNASQESLSEPITVDNAGTIKVNGGKHTTDEHGSTVYSDTPTINGDIFTVKGTTKLAFNNIGFKNESDNVMSVSGGALVTLNAGSVTGNVALRNGGKLSISGSNVFTGDVTTTDEGERTITRNDFGDVTIAKGGNKVLTDVNNKITGYILGDNLPAKIIKVTFKVVNGSWNDGSSTDKYATLTGGQDDELKLSKDQIPAAGEKPQDSTYTAGSWDKEPSKETDITRDTIYTYTYSQKDPAEVKKDPAAKSLTYNGSAQELVTAGTAEGGEIQYALGKDATTPPKDGWSKSVPKGTNAGDYYVWYKAVGDASHIDSDPLCIKVSISEKGPDPVEKSTITFDLDGGTLEGRTGKVELTAENGTVITLPAPTKDGYTFDYWEGSKYYAGDTYTVNGDHTFKAVWKTGAGGDGNKGGSSKNGVNTGDENTLGAWIMLLTAALTGTAGMIFARKKNNN